MGEGHDWDADFRRNALTGIIVRDLAIQSATIAYAPLQEMVERMLTSPEPTGVAVVLENSIAEVSGEVRVLGRRHLRLDPHVPFGHVYEFESMDAYQQWLEWGAPKV